MKLTVKVPTIACEACGNTISKAILNTVPAAQISVDVDTKIVTVDGEASLEDIKTIILDAGHVPE